jgi:Leucine-rich repeat (LRR) protein
MTSLSHQRRGARRYGWFDAYDYMFDIYGMDENTQPMVEINIGNPALEKLIRGIEGSSYTETPKYESDIPGILHPRGVKFYKPDGPLYVQEVTEISALYSFQGQEEKIATLNGIEQCINLRFLALSDHEVTDISLLRSLQNLEYLNLDVDTIRDFSPLLDLPNLIEVDLIGNPPNSDNRKEVAEELRSRGVRVYYY